MVGFIVGTIVVGLFNGPVLGRTVGIDVTNVSYKIVLTNKFILFWFNNCYLAFQWRMWILIVLQEYFEHQ